MTIFSKPQDVLSNSVKLRVNERMSPVFADDKKLAPEIQDAYMQECRERRIQKHEQEQQQKLKEAARRGGYLR